MSEQSSIVLGLTINSVDQLSEGSKVVFISDDPFAPSSWENKVQYVRSIGGSSSILVGCEGNDTHNESRPFGDFRLATKEETETGVVDREVQKHFDPQNSDEEDDADIDDSEDDEMPEFETEQEFQEAEARAKESTETCVVPIDTAKENDWANAGMSNSIVTDTKVVVLEGCEEKVSEILGTTFGDDVHRVTGHSVVDDTITILGVAYPAVLFRFANNLEIESFARDPHFNENAPRVIRDTLNEVSRVQARMNTSELRNEKLPLWVRAGLAIEHKEALDNAGSETLEFLEVEINRLGAIKNGESFKSIITFDEIQPLLPLLKHIIKRVGLEFHSGHTVSYHVHVILSILGKVYKSLKDYPQARTEFSYFQKEEFDVYGGAERFFELYKNMDAFALVFSYEDKEHLSPETFDLSLDDLNHLIDIIQSVLLRYPLSELTLNEEEWEQRPTENKGHTSFQNKRYSRVFKDRNEDGSVQYITELDSLTFVEDLNLSVMYTNGNSTVVHEDAPFMPNKDVYIFVDEVGAFKVPTIDVGRLIPDRSILMRHDGRVFTFKKLEEDNKGVWVEERSTGREWFISTMELMDRYSFNRNKLFSVQQYPESPLTPKTDIPYPAFHAVYNEESN